MTDYREADFSRLKTVPVAKRPNKVDASLLAHPPRSDRSFTAFLDSLPAILAAQDLRYVVDQIVAATGKRAIVAMLGILSAGAGYVPLEPSLPDERTRLMAADAGVRAVVVVPPLTWSPSTVDVIRVLRVGSCEGNHRTIA